jgi:ribosome-associated toxin RatA of RatAB toxin-antitoxin module
MGGELFGRITPLMIMGIRLQRMAACLGLLGCLGAAGVHAADFELTPDETARLSRGETVIRASLDAAQRSGTVRAAMLIDAPPDVVFQAMTHCADALKFVPHLRTCHVLPHADEPNVLYVEHEIDFGWYAPRLRYVFRADLVADRSIAFRQVSGDFKANRGLWELEPAGTRTLLRYRVEIDPPGYVPNWLARSTFKRELPRMLAELKRHCEAGTPSTPTKQFSLLTPH